MAVTITSIRQTGRALQATWVSDAVDPTFYVYVNGELVAVTEATTWIAAADDDEPVFFQIFDDPVHTADVVPGGRVTLSWYRVEGAEAYRIERLIDNVWTEQATIITAEWFNSWRSDFLADQSHQAFRIVPIVQGEAGEPVTVWRFVVRHPDIPQVEFEYDADAMAVLIS